MLALLGISLDSALSFGEEVVDTIGGGGGPRPCVKQAKRGAKQARSVSPSRARQAMRAVGEEGARRILNFPPQSAFCETSDEISIACSGGFDVERYKQAGGDGVKRLAGQVLEAAGVTAVDVSGCSEAIQVAKIVLNRAESGLIHSDPVEGGTTSLPDLDGGSDGGSTSGGGDGGGFWDDLADIGLRILTGSSDLSAVEQRARNTVGGAEAGSQVPVRTDTGFGTTELVLFGAAALLLFLVLRSG